MLAFSAMFSRKGARKSSSPTLTAADKYDIYSMPAGGGPEKRLTENIHQDDGPNYSPDGIYINSDRSGKEAIWRLPSPGAGPNDGQAQMVVSDSLEDWFSPVT
jgi:TolB protein